MSAENGASTGREHLNRRQALGLGGAAAASVAAGSLLASAPAAAAEATEIQAELTRDGSILLRSVSLAQAGRLVAAAVTYVTERKLPAMYILVVDVAGDEKASRRMDGNGIASIALVPPKARTAVAFRRPTIEFGAGTTDAGRIASFTAAGFSLLGGGRPIVERGAVIGAIGVGGGSPEQDDEVARAALAAL